MEWGTRTYETANDGGHAADLKGRHGEGDGADDGKAAKDADDGPEDHSQVAERVGGCVGAVAQEVGDRGGHVGQARRREEGVQVLVDVEVPAGQPAARFVVGGHVGCVWCTEPSIPVCSRENARKNAEGDDMSRIS